MSGKGATDDASPAIQRAIRREGRHWHGGQSHVRFGIAPHRFEAIDGELLRSDEERIAMLAIMPEAVGIDRAVRPGDSRLWRDAIASRDSAER